MSRDGSEGRIDSLKNALNTDQYHRTALGNAVRFNAMLNLVNDFASAQQDGTFDEFTGAFSDLTQGGRRVTRDQFVSTLQESIQNITDEYGDAIRDELQGLAADGRIDLTEDQIDSLFAGDLEDEDLARALEESSTVQEAIGRRGYRTALGQSVARATTQQLGMYQDQNSPFNTGATGAFRSFTNGFVRDDKDFFGSRALYDNVFGQYEDGGESLTMLHRRTINDPNNYMNRTVGDKMMDDVVNRSIYDQTEIIDRVDTEFSRFHGESMVDQLSMTGSGLRAARQTVRRVLAEGSAFGRQMADRGEAEHPIDYAQSLVTRLNENVTTDTGELQNSLDLLNNNLKNRSGQSAGVDGGYVNKAGVAQFVDLVNTAGTRTETGELVGGHISISSFQFQNETISAALSDKIERQVLESVLQRRQGANGGPLQVDLVLAYPRQRNLNDRNSEDTRFGVGSTNYSILGPNLIEAMKLEEVKNNVYDMLRGMGVAEDELETFLKVNIQFRDKKFHPKVYLTDNVAGIGTQNLTGPVGNSINQAGSNFETMRFVANKYKDDEQLAKMRAEYTADARANDRQEVDNSSKVSDITQSLLYRQISSAVEYERSYTSYGKLDRAGGGTSTPILNNRRGHQIGFAGDIYEHMRNTLDYAYETNFNLVNGPQKGNIRKEVAGQNTTHMFMVLDQAFMLQLGSGATQKLLRGEMGEEMGTPFGERDEAYTQYRSQQNKLFDLLIANKASVVVDAKNYREQIINPLKEKIAKSGNARLQENWKRAGQSLGLLAGYELFNPGAASTPEEYTSSMKAMQAELRRQGFTEEAGFSESDLKQLIGLASGNVEMAKAPRQHVKSFGLMDYRQGGSPELISYYMGSSNLGLYSLGIPTGEQGGYRGTDGDLTNTEMGIMLGRRDVDAQLSRATAHKARMLDSGDPADINGILPPAISSVDDWSLNQEEERHELMLAQRHLIHTWKQLGNTQMDNPSFKAVNTAPLWQSNVNHGDLEILKNRLETMAREFGLDPTASRSAFQIVERYGATSGSGVTSINVTLDIAQMLGSSGFMKASASMPKLNFELTVLQGPSRGAGMLDDRTDDGSVPGFVYFVDKNKVVGNGIFSNDSGRDIQVLGRSNYDDDFISSMRDGGRITLKAGESAHMSSLDIVPQMFATLIGEGISRFGSAQAHDKFKKATDQQDIIYDYISRRLTGYGDQIDESGRTDEYGRPIHIKTAQEQIKSNLNSTSLQFLIEAIGQDAQALQKSADADFNNSRDPAAARAKRENLSKTVQEFKQTLQTLVDQDVKEVGEIRDTTVSTALSMVRNMAYQSPQLANVIMKVTGRDDKDATKIQKFKDFQSLMFGSFLQSRDDRTYGGQQGFYRTILMGVGDSSIDERTAGLMYDPDNEPGLHNVAGYARFKPLEYKPTTDIHEVMYRSVASKSTSMGKNDPDLDSLLLESEARDLGDAANLRLMSSIGIGTILNRDDYIVRDDQGNAVVGGEQREIFEAMEAAGVEQGAIQRARNAYLNAASDKFGENKNLLQFYTGPTGKLSQLPQRIKNAMGARPMYQYSFEAQQALNEGRAIDNITRGYLERNRAPIQKVTRKEVERLTQEREDLLIRVGGDEYHPDVVALDKRIDNLVRIGSQAFNNSVAGLGAVFSGRIKSVLNAEQAKYIQKVRSLLFESLEDVLASGELSQESFDELLRVEVMKAGLVNKGLGKMIAGSDNMKYSMSVIQLSGTYNDTFLANPLYGTTYSSKADYQAIQKNQLDIEAMTADERKAAGILNVGMREGYFETQQKSVKASMMGEGGMEVLLQKGDIIVEDKVTGAFVQRRKVNGVWRDINVVDDKRNLATIGNVIDNTSFSDVGSPTLGSQPTTTYGRRGEQSIDYIYDVEFRPGNFTNNEYLLDFKRLRSIVAGSGRRVEGTDSSALVKGVAFFAGRTKYQNMDGSSYYANPFEDIERQYREHYEVGEVGGSLKALLDYQEETMQTTTADGRQIYTPMSSMIQGVFNSNNFKSFFWSHGATILRAQSEGVVGQKGDHFMLNELFSTRSDLSISNAKKLAGALMLNFGTKFISTNQGDQAYLKGKAGELKRTLVYALMAGEYGAYYQQTALATAMQIKAADINKAQAQDTRGLTRAEITSEVLFDKISKKAGYNEMSLGALGVITSEQLAAVMAGDADEAAKLLDTVRKGIIDPVATRASSLGGINFDSSADRQAALVTTAVDLMHQLSRGAAQIHIPSDIDMGNEKVQEVLLNAVGMGGFEDDNFKEDVLQMIAGLNTHVNAVTVFTDITFSFSKDPTGTQTIGKHEAHHLITPYLGNIKKYSEGGQLDKIQHTVAALAALVQGTKGTGIGGSGLAYYDRLARSGFNEKTALNLGSAETDYLFSSFHKEKFLGFYQQGTVGYATDDYVKEYKNINESLVRAQYNWEGFDTIRSINDPTRVKQYNTEGQRVSDIRQVGQALTQVNRFIDKFYPGLDPVEKRRMQDKFLAMSGQEFAMFQLDALTEAMSKTNARFQADPRKSIGKDSTGQFLQRMQNKQMFISIPNLDFSQQNGEIVARTDKQKTISTILPSADDMRVMGAQYADFVDPILGHYKNIASIFVPGTQENTVFEKVRAATQAGIPIVLSTTEFNVYKRIQESAQAMPTELQKGIAGARFQEAMAGKNKYQGFTSTGIGSMLMPFGMAALAQTKLDEAGMRENKARVQAIKESDRKLRKLREDLQPSYTDKEKAYIGMEFLDRKNGVNAEFIKVLGQAKSWTGTQKTATRKISDALGALQDLRKKGFTAEREGLSGSAKAANMVSTLNQMDVLYDQLDVLYSSELENETVKQSVAALREAVDVQRLTLQQQAENLFGLKAYSAMDVMVTVDGNKALYDSRDERYQIVSEPGRKLQVYGVGRRGDFRVEAVGTIVGDDAIPLIGLSTDPKYPMHARSGYIYTDEETGEDEIVQRATFRAAYIQGKTNLPEYPTQPINKATLRPDWMDRPTHHIKLTERSGLAKAQDQVLHELREKYPDTETDSNDQRLKDPAERTSIGFDTGEQFGPPAPYDGKLRNVVDPGFTKDGLTGAGKYLQVVKTKQSSTKSGRHFLSGSWRAETIKEGEFQIKLNENLDKVNVLTKQGDYETLGKEAYSVNEVNVSELSDEQLLDLFDEKRSDMDRLIVDQENLGSGKIGSDLHAKIAAQKQMGTFKYSGAISLIGKDKKALSQEIRRRGLKPRTAMSTTTNFDNIYKVDASYEVESIYAEIDADTQLASKENTIKYLQRLYGEDFESKKGDYVYLDEQGKVRNLGSDEYVEPRQIPSTPDHSPRNVFDINNTSSLFDNTQISNSRTSIDNSTSFSEPNKKINSTPSDDLSDTASKKQRRNAEQVINSTFKNRRSPSPEALAERQDPLYNQLVEFERKQRAAIAFGISSNLQEEYEGMKRDSLETKRQIAQYNNAEFTTVEEKKQAFQNLKAELIKKRNDAYRMAGMDPETGKSIYDQKTGGKGEKASIDGYPVNRPSQQDSYIYHAQALNYEGMITYLIQSGNEPEVEPLSADRVKEIERKQKALAGVEYLLNTTDGADGRNVFEGIGNLKVEFDVNALFVVEQLDPEAGFVENHMKNMNQMAKELDKLGAKREANIVKGEYAIKQIEAQIQMYKNRSEEMHKFSAEREVKTANKQRDAQGNIIMDPEAEDRIRSATVEYDTNTQAIIQYLEGKKKSIQNAMANGNLTTNQIRADFEDIDVEVAITESRNTGLAEVFRSPPPGNTDPRMMTYRVMQGIHALNRLTTMVQQTGVASGDLKQQDTKMIYSTERGQTATVMAALGIVTYGGGDWDGDSYTAIFDQAQEIEGEVKRHQGKVDQAEIMVKAHESQLAEINDKLSKIDTTKKGGAEKYEQLIKRKERIEKSIETRRKAAAYSTGRLKESVRTMEEKIAVGYRGMDARARKQISAYTGIDERFFVSSEDVMYDEQGKVMTTEKGDQIYGLRQGETMSADAMFVFMEQGYALIEGLDSKRNQMLTMFNNVDILTGYRTEPEAFNDDGLLRKMVNGITRDIDDKSVSVESPAVAMLNDRVNSLLTNTQNLSESQRAFLETLQGSDSAKVAMLEQFDAFVRDMDTREAAQRQSGRLETDAAKLAIQRRAHMNNFIGHTLIAGIQSNDTMGKFMQQGMGMTLTEGTFDMTLKTLGKAGGEILGKTYNTIVGTSFQDAPIITYGRQILDETNPLRQAMLNEYQKQAEGNTERQQIYEEEARAQGLSGTDKDDFVRKKLRQEGFDEFQRYTETVQAAVTKSEGVQGFMKNIHQLLRDSIKLKGDADELIPKLEESSEKYNLLSKQMTETDNEEERKDLLRQRDQIIEGMASELGPGPGLKSLIDLDYLTNESDRTGLTKAEYEQRFFNGTIEGSRDRIESMAASMMETGALTADDMADLRSIGDGHTGESKALLKMARTQTTRNLVGLVTSFRMTITEGDFTNPSNRGQAIKEFAASHRAQLATQIEAHRAKQMPSSRTQDGNIDFEAEAGKQVLDMYTGSIAKENEGSRFNAFRQHQEALASHLGMEASTIYQDDGVTLRQEYRDNLDSRARSMGVSTEEYTLMFDHQYQQTVSNIDGLWGDDGQKMDQFTVMNMFRKDIARAMMDGRPPNADKAEFINQAIGSEMMTTMAQAAASGKLDAQGMDMFTAMNKGVVRHLVEATNQEVTYLDKKTGEHKTVAFNDLDRKQQQSVITKIAYQNMFGTTEDGSPMGYHRATSDDARSMRIKTGQLIGNSELEMREDGTLGNDLLDALDKSSTGSSTGAQIEMYEALGEEYLRETLDNEVMREDLLKRYLKADGVDPNSDKAEQYRKQVATTVQYQIKSRQDKMMEQYNRSRGRHRRGYGVQNRTSFMNNLNSQVIGQLAKDSSANALDLVAPLLLTAAGTAISEGNISGEQVMALGGAAFTAFQYARTGAIDFNEMDPAEAKTRMAATQAASGIFKLKNAMANNNDNFGAAVAQVAVQEATSIAFNAVAAPWLSRNIADKALGAGAAPAMNALDMNKYKAGQQLAGNIGASLISAVSSTVISGVIMNTMQENKPSLSETIRSFLPAAQAVSQVNEAVARRRAQEAAMEDFEAETDGTDDTIEEYMVVTDATYNPDDYASIADLQAAEEIEPGSDGSLSVGIVG